MKAAGVFILIAALTMTGAWAQPAPHKATYPDLQDTPLRPPLMAPDEVTRLMQDLSVARARQLQRISPPQQPQPTAKRTPPKPKGTTRANEGAGRNRPLAE